MAGVGTDIVEKLENARVGIAGCGGLGSTVAVALARSGVGSLVLADFDAVETSNLNRQQYFVDQVGQPKVNALTVNLLRIRPRIRLEQHRVRVTRANALQLFEKCNVVAECFDHPAAKAELSMSMRRLLPEIPLVAASGIAGYGPASAIRCRRVLGNHFLIGDGISAVEQGGLFAPRVAIAAGCQANVVLRLLLGAIAENEGE